MVSGAARGQADDLTFADFPQQLAQMRQAHWFGKRAAYVEAEAPRNHQGFLPHRVIRAADHDDRRLEFGLREKLQDFESAMFAERQVERDARIDAFAEQPPRRLVAR